MEQKEKSQKTEKPAVKSGVKYAVVRIRSGSRTDSSILDTLQMLRLHKKFTCVILDKTPAVTGMLDVAKDFIAYGEVDAETIKLLEEKRGQKNSEGKLRKDFHLAPPRGGFERKGVKRSFAQGGATGYRGLKMIALIKRMV